MYHESTISTKLASHNMRWRATGQCQGGSPTFSFLCSFSFIAEPFTQTLAWSQARAKIRKNTEMMRWLGLPSYSLRQVHFQAADMFWPQARKNHAFSISHFVAFDLFRPFCQALSHRTTTPSWKFSISHRCSGMPSPCSNALTFWNHLQLLFATATKIKCHRQEVGACSTILLSWFEPMVMGCLHQSKSWWGMLRGNSQNSNTALLRGRKYIILPAKAGSCMEEGSKPSHTTPLCCQVDFTFFFTFQVLFSLLHPYDEDTSMSLAGPKAQSCPRSCSANTAHLCQSRWSQQLKWLKGELSSRDGMPVKRWKASVIYTSTL